MNRKTIRTALPNPATVIALVALFVALGGGAYAASNHNGVAHASKKKKAARGPQGPQGPAGRDGTDGADGTARAYALVHSSDFSCSPNCQIEESKGITNVTYIGNGSYCVHASGIDARSEVAAVTVDWGQTNSPAGNSTATANGNCDTSGFEVVTERQPSVGVRNAADNGTTQVAGNAVTSNSVAFTIVIP
jgi:hypothetical protein